MPVLPDLPPPSMRARRGWCVWGIFFFRKSSASIKTSRPGGGHGKPFEYEFDFVFQEIVGFNKVVAAPILHYSLKLELGDGKSWHKYYETAGTEVTYVSNVTNVTFT